MSRILHITALLFLPLALACEARPAGSMARASWGSPDPSYMLAQTEQLIDLAQPPIDGGPPPPGSADVSIFANGPSAGMVGEAVYYSSGGYNYGPATASKVAVTISLAGTFDSHKWSAWPDCFEDPPKPGLLVVRCTLAQLTTVDKLPPITVAAIPRADGKLTYTAEVSAAEPDPNPVNNGASVVTAIGSAPTGADLAAYAYGPSELMVGETGTAYFWIENRGPAMATRVALDLAARGPVELVVSPPCVPTSLSTAICALRDLRQYEGVEVRAGIRPLAAGEIVLGGVASSAVADPWPGNNTASVRTIAFVPVIADLAVAVSDEPDPTVWKRPLTYATTVSNGGPDASGGAYLWQSVPEEVKVESVTPSQGWCWSDPWGVYCDLGRLPAGSAATVTVVVVPQLGGTLTVKAEVYGQEREIDPDWSNDYAAESTTVHGGYPAVTSTDNLRLPITMAAYIPCAGDYVLLEGDLHVLTHTTINRDHYQLVYAAQPQGLRGVGLMTGAVYNGTGGTREMERRSRTDLGGELTYVNNYRMVSRGPYPNLTVHQVLHLTVHPDGHVTGYVDEERIECR